MWVKSKLTAPKEHCYSNQVVDRYSNPISGECQRAKLENGVELTGLYIRAGSRRSSPASLPGFAGYFHCFTSKDMSR